MKPMFGFLTPQGKDSPDPLQNAKTAAAWLRQLPALDVVGRQQHVIRALDAMKKAQRGADINRVAAVQFVDAALGADRRQLIKQYVENIGECAEACRADLAGIVGNEPVVHRCLSGGARRSVAQAGNSRWRSALPLCSCVSSISTAPTRSFVCSSTSVGFRRKWIELHQIYLRACEMQCDREAVALPAAGSSAQSVVGRAGISLRASRASTQHRQSESDRDRLGKFAIARLEPPPAPRADSPKSLEGFFVDLAGREGLVQADRQRSRLGVALPRHDDSRRRSSIARSRHCAAAKAPTRGRSRRSTSSGCRYCARYSRRFRRPRRPNCVAIRAYRGRFGARAHRSSAHLSGPGRTHDGRKQR